MKNVQYPPTPPMTCRGTGMRCARRRSPALPMMTPSFPVDHENAITTRSTTKNKSRPTVQNGSSKACVVCYFDCLLTCLPFIVPLTTPYCTAHLLACFVLLLIRTTPRRTDQTMTKRTSSSSSSLAASSSSSNQRRRKTTRVHNNNNKNDKTNQLTN